MIVRAGNPCAKRKKATPAGPPFAKRAYIAQRPFSSTVGLTGAGAGFQPIRLHASAISATMAWPCRTGEDSRLS